MSVQKGFQGKLNRLMLPALSQHRGGSLGMNLAMWFGAWSSERIRSLVGKACAQAVCRPLLIQYYQLFFHIDASERYKTFPIVFISSIMDAIECLLVIWWADSDRPKTESGS